MKTHLTLRLFKDTVGCLVLFCCGVALLSLPVPDMKNLGSSGIRASGAALILLTLGPILTHLNWFNMRTDLWPALAEQARWELEVENHQPESYETKWVEYVAGSDETKWDVAEEESEFEEIIITRRVVKHPPQVRRKPDEVPVWKRLADKGDGYEEFWLAEDEDSEWEEDSSLPNRWSSLEDRYEEIYMDVVWDDSDETSPEKKSIHEPRRKSLPPAAEKPKVVVSRKPLPEPEKETPEAEQRMSSKMVDTPQDTKMPEVVPRTVETQSEPLQDKKPQMVTTGVDPCFPMTTHESQPQSASIVAKPEVTSTGVNTEMRTEDTVAEKRSQLKQHKDLGSATDPQILPNKIDTGVNPTIQESLMDNKRVGTATPEAVMTSENGVSKLVPSLSDEKKGEEPAHLKSSDAKIEPRSAGIEQVQKTSSLPSMKPEIMTKPSQGMLQHELSLKIQNREQKQAEMPPGLLGERLQIEEQCLKVEKVPNKDKLDNKQSVDQSSMKAEDSDSSEFVTPQSSPDMPFLTIRRVDRTKDCSQYTIARDMIETRIGEEKNSGQGGGTKGPQESHDEDSWVQSVVEKLSADPGKELHLKTTKREEEITKEKITMRDEDTNEVKIEERVKADIAEEQVMIDKTF